MYSEESEMLAQGKRQDGAVTPGRRCVVAYHSNRRRNATSRTSGNDVRCFIHLHGACRFLSVSEQTKRCAAHGEGRKKKSEATEITVSLVVTFHDLEVNYDY